MDRFYGATRKSTLKLVNFPQTGWKPVRKHSLRSRFWVLPVTQGGTKGLSDLYNHKLPPSTGSYPHTASPQRRHLRPGTNRGQSQLSLRPASGSLPTCPRTAPAASSVHSTGVTTAVRPPGERFPLSPAFGERHAFHPVKMY